MVTIMKKLLNLKYMAFFAVLALFSACTESEDDYTPAKPSAVEETEYYFNRTQPTSAVISLAASEYVVSLERINSEEEITLDLIVNAEDSVFTVPETVTFKAGESTADIVIAINDKMDVFVEYAIEISLPEEYINPWKVDNYSIFTVKLTKDDYAPFAKAVYHWGFTNILVGIGVSFEQEILYSAYLNAYRMVSPWSTPAETYVAWGCGAEAGDNVEFEIDEETGKVTLLGKTVFKSGLIHPNYGSVSANFVDGELDEDGNINFEYKWTVSAGSFGTAVDQLEIIDLYE